MRSDVTIADDDKLQFYLEEIYDSNRFDKQEMLTWERQPTATKTDVDLAKVHFKEIANATDTYEQNAGGASGRIWRKPIDGHFVSETQISPSGTRRQVAPSISGLF